MLLLSTGLRRSLSISRSCSRSLFSLPSFSSFPVFESKPQIYNEQKIFPYSEKELYAVVADVASYPRFIPFCIGSRIDKSAFQQAMQKETVIDAELTVGFLSFKESYVSTVTCRPFESVQAVASSATPLFKALSTTWRFGGSTKSQVPSSSSNGKQDPLIETLVSFNLTYEFADPIYASVSSTFFGRVSKLMIKAFEDRCVEVYGPRQLS
ncbi:dehydrase and lipid transport-domain-containing protein [Crassisporium funariophilum]|nr:dehydrase and lipid transport-domain-containing protein [Crassisporium funariophilum]